MAGQFGPEQQQQAGQTAGTAQHDAWRRDQAAGNPLRGRVKAQEVQAEQEQSLAQAQQVAAQVQLLQFAQQRQRRHHDQRGQREAVEDGNGDGHHAKLQLDGDPGRAPDEHGEQVQGQVHDSGQDRAPPKRTAPASMRQARPARLPDLALLCPGARAGARTMA
ncbi:Uncharacterised protein [Bordetella pertussis]|nr:Uncharacterised protein [Bordetella pertussis]